MTPAELRSHKNATKTLAVRPTFKALKRGKLPKPFHRMGGSRLYSTEPIKLSDTHCVVFMYRDGEILSDTAFFGHLMCSVGERALYPLFEFHWHPSHKGFHAKMPCKTGLDYTNRMLPGAPELQISTRAELDPRNEDDRTALINEFCEACGIYIADPNDTATIPLWK
ncbi:MAG: hypothetical protein KUL86_11210 [Castellaniella sp.]|nr:hypothetical protein [Castellaniella sp.]